MSVGTADFACAPANPGKGGPCCERHRSNEISGRGRRFSERRHTDLTALFFREAFLRVTASRVKAAPVSSLVSRGLVAAASSDDDNYILQIAGSKQLSDYRTRVLRRLTYAVHTHTQYALKFVRVRACRSHGRGEGRGPQRSGKSLGRRRGTTSCASAYGRHKRLGRRTTMYFTWQWRRRRRRRRLLYDRN